MVRLVACLTLAAWRLSCRRLGGRVVEGIYAALAPFSWRNSTLVRCRPNSATSVPFESGYLLRPRSAGSESDDGLPCAERTRTARIVTASGAFCLRQRICSTLRHLDKHRTC